MSVEILGEKVVMVEGRLHVPARALASLHGLTPDYVSRLARSGRIEATKLAGVWYVSLASFANFRERDRDLDEDDMSALAGSPDLDDGVYSPSE
jgi:hypothetical protein